MLYHYEIMSKYRIGCQCNILLPCLVSSGKINAHRHSNEAHRNADMWSSFAQYSYCNMRAMLPQIKYEALFGFSETKHFHSLMCHVQNAHSNEL